MHLAEPSRERHRTERGQRAPARPRSSFDTDEANAAHNSNSVYILRHFNELQAHDHGQQHLARSIAFEVSA